jgi:hypothetical protein
MPAQQRNSPSRRHESDSSGSLTPELEPLLPVAELDSRNIMSTLEDKSTTKETVAQPRSSGSVDSPGSDSESRIDQIVQKIPKKTWKSYVWDTLDKSPEERRFLFKLDTVLLTFASLGYFIKYLDQVNINNAFVSGMKEDLGLFGNQLNYMQTCWTVGYVIGEIPR